MHEKEITQNMRIEQIRRSNQKIQSIMNDFKPFNLVNSEINRMNKTHISYLLCYFFSFHLRNAKFKIA